MAQVRDMAAGTAAQATNYLAVRKDWHARLPAP